MGWSFEIRWVPHEKGWKVYTGRSSKDLDSKHVTRYLVWGAIGFYVTTWIEEKEPWK